MVYQVDGIISHFYECNPDAHSLKLQRNAWSARKKKTTKTRGQNDSHFCIQNTVYVSPSARPIITPRNDYHS